MEVWKMIFLSKWVICRWTMSIFQGVFVFNKNIPVGPTGQAPFGLEQFFLGKFSIANFLFSPCMASRASLQIHETCRWCKVAPVSYVEFPPRQTHLFSAIYRGELTPFYNWEGPTLWFQTFFIFSRYLGRWSNLTSIFFQRGLKPPTSIVICWVCFYM